MRALPQSDFRAFPQPPKKSLVHIVTVLNAPPLKDSCLTCPSDGGRGKERNAAPGEGAGAQACTALSSCLRGVRQPPVTPSSSSLSWTARTHQRSHGLLASQVNCSKEKAHADQQSGTDELSRPLPRRLDPGELIPWPSGLYSFLTVVCPHELAPWETAATAAKVNNRTGTRPWSLGNCASK